MNTPLESTLTTLPGTPAGALRRPIDIHGPSPTDRDFAAMRSAYRASGGIARGDELARLLDDHSSGEFVNLAGFIAKSEIFGFDWHEAFWVPMFQFDLHDLSIRPGPLRVIAVLAPVFDGWSLAVWFAQRNSWLQGRRPVDLLGTELADVLQAAGADRYIATG
jgi:hypothetical protein